MLIIPKIKICGITTLQEIQYINKYKINYVGFVFAKSKRQVTINEAKLLSAFLDREVKKVGVFVDSSKEEIRKTILEVGLDVIQLHGKERPDNYKDLNIEIWKSISIKDESSILEIDENESADAFVLDTYSKEKRGGTGKAFDWNWVSNIKSREKIVLAGGLNSNNVHEGIIKVKPDIVDVSSGVESEFLNGKKDEEKIRKFIRSVRNAKIR